jgi:hypothetical protein
MSIKADFSKRVWPEWNLMVALNDHQIKIQLSANGSLSRRVSGFIFGERSRNRFIGS